MRTQRLVSLVVQLRPLPPTCLPRRSIPLPPFPVLSVRSYATHREAPHPSSIPGTRTGGSAFDGQDTVGPFPLGVGPSGRSKTWKKWGELNVKGKLGRTVRQTGNLGVILFGGGLFVLLTLSLTTELFAKNSPSVLYSQAVDKIRESDALNPYLLPPLSFTHTPHAAAPVRGTTPVAHRTVKHPSSGRDHMILTFYVHGRGAGEPEPLHWAKDAWGTVESYAKEAGKWAGLVEDNPVQEEKVVKVEEKKVVEEGCGNGWLGSLLGGFTGLRAVEIGSSKGSPARGLPPPGTYKVGEVHGDYVKNAGGQYQLLSLIIDVPSSAASYPGRAVVYWSPEADREGLLGRIGSRGR